MTKVVLLVLAAMAIASAAYAACPAGTAYHCYQGMGGKVICGCR